MDNEEKEEYPGEFKDFNKNSHFNTCVYFLLLYFFMMMDYILLDFSWL